MVIIFILSMISLMMDEWHTIDYRKSHFLTLKRHSLGSWFSSAVMILILASIVTEALKAVSSIWNQYKINKAVKAGKLSGVLSFKKETEAEIHPVAREKIKKSNKHKKVSKYKKNKKVPMNRLTNPKISQKQVTIQSRRNIFRSSTRRLLSIFIN